MSDETVHYAREAVIRHDGRGEVRDAEGAEAVTAADADELRAVVMQRIIEFATDVGAPVNLRVADVDGVYRLVVHPGGAITEEGGFEPLGPGDDVLWSGGGGAHTGAAADVDDVAGDDGGFHDEGLDSDFGGLGDEPVDGDFEVPVSDRPAAAHGGRHAGASASGASPDVSRPAWPEPEPEPDGGYSALFGRTDGDGTAANAADVHETIQLPRPGMMREEPPAVTGLQPIVPPSGAGGGADDGDDGLDGGDGLDGDDLLAVELEDEDVHDDAETDGRTPEDGVDDAFDEAGPGESAGDDRVVADWGTGGLDIVTGAIATPRTWAGAGEAEAPGERASDAGDETPVPAALTGEDAYGDGGRSTPEWTPRFPRAAAAPQAPVDQTSPADRTSAGDQSPAGVGPWLAPAGPQAPGPVQAPGAGWPQQHGQAGADRAPTGHAADARGVSAAPAGSTATSSTTEAGPTLGDFLAENTTRKDPLASRGWRAGLRRGTGGLLKLGPGARERAEREEIATIQKPLDGPKTVVVVNPKGGAHKTTTTLMIAAMFGMHRGGYTLAWDNNETRGTLGWRSHRANHQRTAVDLLRQLSHFEISGGATIADIDRFVRNQGTAKFDVLASDDDAASAAIIDADAFWRLHRTLSRFYRVVVIDTGNNMRASNWEAALELADQLVIVSTAREDTAASAAWLADGLRERGYADKLADAVTILSSPSSKEDPQLQARLRDHFTQLTRAVVEVPYDEEFVGGGELHVEQLRPETRDAWRHAAAVIAQGL
ncbi:hypothetical protein [Pseudoclavibacter endophyticus]|uniref:Chromosome partitioning protein n=1 Tax=Pseudoclavibacter endophyticus TaxID=1778590 RepID=A0A6H9WNR7_9MICO|nr:hypothetical protein [Pseudoclavibacter endophyticus]KAB1649351.1 hypothetical protein F8O04_03525 [Pseudoclavibacter endophyticus]